MPQMKPLNWLLIFFLFLMSFLVTFSFFPLYTKSLILKKLVVVKENKMKW